MTTKEAYDLGVAIALGTHGLYKFAQGIMPAGGGGIAPLGMRGQASPMQSRVVGGAGAGAVGPAMGSPAGASAVPALNMFKPRLTPGPAPSAPIQAAPPAGSIPTAARQGTAGRSAPASVPRAGTPAQSPQPQV